MHHIRIGFRLVIRAPQRRHGGVGAESFTCEGCGVRGGCASSSSDSRVQLSHGVPKCGHIATLLSFDDLLHRLHHLLAGRKGGRWGSDVGGASDAGGSLLLRCGWWKNRSRVVLGWFVWYCSVARRRLCGRHISGMTWLLRLHRSVEVGVGRWCSAVVGVSDRFWLLDCGCVLLRVRRERKCCGMRRVLHGSVLGTWRWCDRLLSHWSSTTLMCCWVKGHIQPPVPLLRLRSMHTS